MQTGERLAGRVIGEPRTRGPVFDVVPLTVDGRVTHTALLYPPVVAAHPWFSAGLAAHAHTHGSPEVSGVAALVQAEAERGALVYDTGAVVPLAHVFERLASRGRSLGGRASLELAYLCADLLVRADAALGPHGQVNPWTIALDQRGRPQLLAHGVPCVEHDLDRPGSGFSLREDSLRYAPPERFGSDPVDLRSDLFALWLVVAEGVLGRPLYDGVIDDLRHQARRGDAQARWYPHRDRVSPELDELITSGLKPDWAARRSDPVKVVQELYALAQRFDAEGDSLAEVVGSVSGTASNPAPLPTPGAQAAVEALDPDARWPSGSARPRTLYDPQTGVTSRYEEASTEAGPAVSRPRRTEDRDARREALRERLKGGPTAAMPRSPTTTTAIHGQTDYVTLDPLTDVRPTGRPGEPIATPASATTRIVDRGEMAPAAAPAGLSWRIVAHGGRAARVPVFEPDRVGTVALRAAIELGALPVDTSGRVLCGYALSQGGRRYAGTDAMAELPAGPLELVEVPVELRLVTVQVETSPPLRFRSPTSLAVPAAWFVAGIVQWLGLPEAPWAAHVDGVPIDRDVLLADVMGRGDLIVLAPVRGR